MGALGALAVTAALGFAGAAFGQAVDGGLGLQTPVTTVAERANSFHNLLLVICAAIVLFVLALLLYVTWRFRASRNPVPSKTTHNTTIEVVWTLVPIVILIIIVVPSMRLLYYLDRAEDPEMTLIVNGYQWHWGYEYPDQQIPEFLSYMLGDDELAPGQPRLLATDAPVVLPVDTDIQILVGAGDVLHAFAVPAFFVKIDAVPGRLNETWVRINEPGVYYGQCSELCGTNHAFMPIEVHAVTREEFDAWVMQRVAGLDLSEPPVLLTTTYEEALARQSLARAGQ